VSTRAAIHHFFYCLQVASKGMVRKNPETMAAEAEERAVKEAADRAAEVIGMPFMHVF